MNTSELDLDAYFERIGYAGPGRPDLATLRALQAAHCAAIPFETIDALLRRPVRLDTAALQRKLVGERRGGWCFEQNRLFLLVLKALGFDAGGLAARVLWNRAEEPLPPRSHMLLRVELPEGTQIVDVGFGGPNPIAPLALEAGIEQRTPLETYRLTPAEGDFVLEAKLGERWARLYRFSTEPQQPVDYEVANWFVSSHPSSQFLQHLMAARVDEARRYALLDTRLTMRHGDGRVEQRDLASDEVPAILARYFRLSLAPELAAALVTAVAGLAGGSRPPAAHVPR